MTAPTTTSDAPTSDPTRVRAALTVSLLSIAFTLAGSGAAVTIGIVDGSGALVAFGAVGLVDALGSAGLAYHFRHALHHERISEELEVVAHRIVLGGLVIVGAATVAVNTVRLAEGARGGASSFGVALAAVSLVVLGVLSARKTWLAPRVPSPALRADGHLSAVGACLAAITLAGTAATRAFGWDWADSGAAILVGAVALSLGIASARTERRRRRV